MRPDVVMLGFGKVKLMLAVVWVTSKVVATSTVLAALPIELFAAWLLMATELKSELPPFVKFVPLPMVRPPPAVTRPVVVKVVMPLRAPAAVTVRPLVGLIEKVPLVCE